MNNSLKNWTKSFLFILFLLVLTLILPNKAIDPWNIFIPKKIATLVFTLAIIQALGAFVIELFGQKVGSFIAGFLGGLISSTAVTASIASKSKNINDEQIQNSVVIIIAATGAMLFEAILLIVSGIDGIFYAVYIIFSGPVLYTIYSLYKNIKKNQNYSDQLNISKFKILNIIKLSLFIFATIAMSKVFESIFGKIGIIFLTFFVSLFEIHGSIISNIQLYSAGIISKEMFGGLIAVSILASYISKIFLISTIGSHLLANKALKYTFSVVVLLILSWGLFTLFI